jgi:hypothetical protein
MDDSQKPLFSPAQEVTLAGDPPKRVTIIRRSHSATMGCYRYLVALPGGYEGSMWASESELSSPSGHELPLP